MPFWCKPHSWTNPLGITVEPSCSWCQPPSQAGEALQLETDPLRRTDSTLVTCTKGTTDFPLDKTRTKHFFFGTCFGGKLCCWAPPREPRNRARKASSWDRMQDPLWCFQTIWWQPQLKWSWCRLPTWFGFLNSIFVQLNSCRNSQNKIGWCYFFVSWHAQVDTVMPCERPQSLKTTSFWDQWRKTRTYHIKIRNTMGLPRFHVFVKIHVWIYIAQNGECCFKDRMCHVQRHTSKSNSDGYNKKIERTWNPLGDRSLELDRKEQKGKVLLCLEKEQHIGTWMIIRGSAKKWLLRLR